MRDFFVNLFQTPAEAKPEITLFSIWHILYVVIILGAILFLALLFRKLSQKAQNRLILALTMLPIGLYAADFFIMPLAYGNIDVDKLPFHFCTMLSILILFVQFGKPFGFMREAVTALAIVTPMMYLCYPGSALGGITPFCYQVIQTFLYHGAVMAWGVCSVVLGKSTLRFKNIWKPLLLICAFLAWGSFGNAVYSTTEHHYDWCFVTGSTFPFIPKLLMPLAVLGAVGGLVAAIYGISYAIRAIYRKCKG